MFWRLHESSWFMSNVMSIRKKQFFGLMLSLLNLFFVQETFPRAYCLSNSPFYILCVQEVVTHFINSLTIWFGSLLLGHIVVSNYTKSVITSWTNSSWSRQVWEKYKMDQFEQVCCYVYSWTRRIPLRRYQSVHLGVVSKV